MLPFVSFRKIPRLNRDVVITEKLDGTNASVYIADASLFDKDDPVIDIVDGLALCAGSRNRWITPDNDNYGFAKWVKTNATELVKLGVGHHFGEWWGQGIQRGYGLQEKRFSLFNTSRWYDQDTNLDMSTAPEICPECCYVVPILYSGTLNLLPTWDNTPQAPISGVLGQLKEFGSLAADGWRDPEGIIVYHTTANVYFKVTCKDDDKAKGLVP